MVDMASKDFSNDLSLALHSSSVFPLKTMSSILRFVEVDDSYHWKMGTQTEYKTAACKIGCLQSNLPKLAWWPPSKAYEVAEGQKNPVLKSSDIVWA